MIRETVGKQLDHDPNFRWRGQAVTRIENLSDIAFALALGMIISGTDAPRTYADMMGFLYFMIPAAAGFAVLLGIWTAHYTFFRRYGVADGWIIFINAVLIFLVLGMAYPLRFTFDSLFAWIVGMATGDLSIHVDIGVMDFQTSGKIIAVFSALYGVAYVLLALMYRHVLSRRDLLALDAAELRVTRQDHLRYWLCAGLAFFVAWVGWATSLNGFAGFLLTLTGACAAASRLLYRDKSGLEIEPGTEPETVSHS